MVWHGKEGMGMEGREMKVGIVNVDVVDVC